MSVQNCACGACGWWGEGRGDAWCQVSGLIMALPAQSAGRLASYISVREVTSNKASISHMCAPTPLASARTYPTLLAHNTARRPRKGERGVSCDTQTDNKSKPARQAGREEAPAQCHCSGYSSPDLHYPSVSTSISVSVLFSKGAFAPLYLNVI